MQDLTALERQLLSIQDWRHPYQIANQQVALDKAWWADWHPWRWGVDLPILRQALQDTQGKTLLDVACNDGWYSFQAREAGFTATGIDIRAEATDRAKRLAQYFATDKVDFLTGDIEDKTVLSGRYDATLFYGILYHLSDPIGTLQRVGELTNRIICVQTFCHTLDNRPALYLFREDPDLAGNAMVRLVTTPTQRAVVIMLKEAGFDHVYRAMPENYLAGKYNSTAAWQWCFFYGVKGAPLQETPTLRRITDTDPPLNAFGPLQRLRGHLVSYLKRRRGADIDDPTNRARNR